MRDYVYLAHTRTLCNDCKKVIDGKVVYNDQGVHIVKECPQCGIQKELLEEDTAYHLSKFKFDKKGTESTIQTAVEKGCPFDCGLCPSHDQHTCIGLIEITKRCNLHCEMCFAKSGEGEDLPIAQIEKMMDFFIQAENGIPEILQISGGEPTLHPQVLDIIAMAKAKGFKYVMLNTNGLRLVEDLDFVKALAQFKGGFEVYLQFDGTNDHIYQTLRHEKLWDMKKKALAHLSKYQVPTTLVCTVAENVNDQQIGELLVYGMNQKCVRGVNFQPLSYYGESRPTPQRVTLSGILKRLETQTNQMIQVGDFMPLPCNVERVAITYLFKDKGSFVPITRGKDFSQYKDAIGNTFMFHIEDTLENLKENSTIFNVCACCDLMQDIQKFLPLHFAFKSKDEKMKFVDENTFRISATSFLDLYNFDMKSMQKECVHIITPDLKRIPFSAYNMIHRE